MRNKIFEKIPVTLPQRSGFDLSHENSGTGKPGLLIPVFTRECDGRDSLSVNLAQQIQFPPFATDFYGRVKAYFEAFFVPYRILYGGYKRMYEQALDTSGSHGESNVGAGVNKYWPGLLVNPDSVSGTSDDNFVDSSLTGIGYFGRGTLLDYLGVKSLPAVGSYRGTPLRLNNINRLLAYHKIFDEYYRDSRIEARCFSEPYGLNTSGILQIWSLPYIMLPAGSQHFFETQLDASQLANGYSIIGFHSRPYAKDYFTMATPEPQFGNDFGVSADTDGVITISQIRAANALQQFAELYNRVGLHYDDLAFAQTGIRPSDAAVDIPVYLGRLVYDVYNKSVFQNSNDNYSSEFQVGRPNPFYSVGSKYANGQSVGSGHLCDFTATEGGIFMVLMSVAPDAVYSSGTARQWKYSTLVEMPKPQLAGIGDQPIYEGEIVDAYGLDSSNIALTPFDENRIFGYTQRFAEAKFMLDEVHGELREGGTLSAFQLKRNFSSGAEINSSFLKVPVSALNEVSAVGFIQDEGPFVQICPFFWFDLYFETKLVSNLPAYSLPTLENMHGSTAMVDNGGRRL